MHSNNFCNLPEDDLSFILANVDDWSLLKGKRILITGATGFVGKWILGSLLHADFSLKLGVKIVVLSRDIAKFKNTFPELTSFADIDWVQGDVRTVRFSDDFRCDYAIHAATDVVQQRRASEIFDDCVTGTSNLIENLNQAGCNRMLLLSSGAVYGPSFDSASNFSEDYLGAPDSMDPKSAYAEGKRASELVSVMASSEIGLSVSVARCFAFVGPHLPLDKHFAIGNFISSAMKNQTINIKGDGTPLRSYLYAADMAVWLWIILFSGKNCRAYNVGGSESVSIRELAQRVVSSLGSSSDIIIGIPPKMGQAPQKYIPNLGRSTSELGLKVQFDLEMAVYKTAEFHKEM